MIIQGVFSMSILERLKSLFGGKKDKEEKEVSNEVNTTSVDKSNVTSSKNEKKDNTIVSGTKTSESISKRAPETEDKKSKDSSAKDMPSKTEDKSSDEKTEAPKKEEKAVSNKGESKEESADKVEESKDKKISEDEVNNKESNKNDKESDNMTLLTDKELINDENLDKDFTAEFIDAGIETVKHCFQCGTCGGSCPSGRRTPYKVRQIVRKCLLGLKEEVISDDALWMCTTCYTCQERCPRSVIIVGIIKKARNIAAHAGYMALAHKKTGEFVINTGHGVPINDAVLKLRKSIGLEEVPPTTHKFPEALKEIQTICKITAFDDLIGYDESTGKVKE